MTPNIGLGGNSSMESVVALANLLDGAVKAHPQGKPDKAMIEDMLAEYQRSRSGRMRKIVDFSSRATKMQAWDNLWYKALSYILPLLPETTFAVQLSKLIKGAPKLDYVPLPDDTHVGTWKWEDEEREEEKAKKGGESVKKSLSIRPQVSFLSMCVLLSFVYLIGFRI